MTMNTQKKHHNSFLMLCMLAVLFVLLAACDSGTGGNGQPPASGGQGGGPGSSNGVGGQGGGPSSNGPGGLSQRPDPCTLISAAQVQQLVSGSQIFTAKPGGNLKDGGIESSCSFKDANGIEVFLSIIPTFPTWSGIKSLQKNNPSGIPAIKGIGDDALYYGDLCVLKGDYMLQVKVTNSNVDASVNQQQEQQIAREALKKW